MFCFILGIVQNSDRPASIGKGRDWRSEGQSAQRPHRQAIRRVQG